MLMSGGLGSALVSQGSKRNPPPKRGCARGGLLLGSDPWSVTCSHL